MKWSINMDNFILENTTKVYFGKGCVKEYLAYLVKSYNKNVMFCYGEGSIKKNGIYKEVSSILETTGIEVYEFPGIMPCPSYNKIIEGAEFAKKHQIGLVLGAGGGSVIDFCKAVSVAAKYNGNVWADFWEKLGIFSFEPVPAGIIPTLASTGSVCNGKAVITNEDINVRKLRDYPQCSPDFALFDPSYTYSVPEFQMVSGGFSILSNVMEIYFSGPDEDNVTDDITEALIKNIIRNLKMAVYNPEDYTARSNLMWDSVISADRITRAGKKPSSCLCKIVHQLEAYTGCNYGAGLAILQPVYYYHIYKENIAKFKRFAVNVWGITEDGRTGEEIAVSGIEALCAFIKEIRLPLSLHELGLEKDTDLEAIAVSCASAMECCNKMTYREILEIFKESFGKNS